jgi:hypothetical protein
MKAFGAYAVVATVGGLGSVLICLVALGSLRTITDEGMWAIAAMVAVPALMAGAVAYFIHRSHLALGGQPAPGTAAQLLPPGREKSARPLGGYLAKD